LPAQKDIKKFYDQMDVLVLPSLSEGLPMTLLEGMAMELPVVATRVGGVPDVIKDGFNGLLVDPQNVEQLAEAIKKIINMTHDLPAGQAGTRHLTQGQTRELEELTKNARETVELHFSTQRMVAEYLNVYKNL
jgi:glycosyltransferase involved in cell wall biosynthesis